MANGADGSIIIDTGLDNTGFERGSQRMQQAIRGVTQAINQSGRAAANGMQPLFSACQQAGSSINAAAQSAETLNSRLSSAVSSSDFGKSMSAAERSCTSLGNQLQRLADSERMGIKTDAQMVRFQVNVDKARDSATQLEAELQRLGSQQVTTSEYEQLAVSAQKAEQALFRLYDRRDVMEQMGTSKTSREWQRLEIQIQNAEYALESYERSMQSMQANGTAYVSGADTTQYQEMSSALRNMQAQLASYEQTAAGFDVISAPAASSEASLRRVDSELRQKPEDASAAGNAMRKFGSVLKSAASTALRMNAALAKMVFKGVSTGTKAAANGLKKFFSKTKDGVLSSQGLVKSLTSLKTILLSSIKSTLISGTIQSIKACMSSLAQYSSAFNASMSSMKNAVKGLSANLAVTFGNLVNAVAPAISTIISWISRAISYLNAFFALLSGKGTVTVAKKQTDEYAKSLGGAAGAAKELKNEVYGFDELNKASSTDSGGGGGGGSSAGDLYEDVPIESLLPESVQNFFTSLKTAFEAGDWEGIGEIVAGGLNSIVTAVDDWIVTVQPLAVEWANRIALILNGLVSGFDWANLGKLISDGLNLVFSTLNTFLSTFDWATLGAGLAAGLNSVFENTDWATIGATFANKWNALINAIEGFVTTINWQQMGASIGTGVQSWFNTINWSGLVTSVNASIKGVFNAITSFMQSIQWADVGKKIGDIVNGLDVAGMIASITTSLNTFVSSAFTLANTVLASVKWEDLGKQFAGIVNGLDIEQWLTDWGTFISNFTKSAMDAAIGFIEGIEWTELGTALYNAVTGYYESIDWEGLVSRMFELLGAAIGGATALIASLASNIWDGIKQAWEDVKTYFGEYFDEYGGNIIAGLLAGILNAILDIGTWIYDNIFKPFIDGFKAAFGIASPSTVMKEQGGFIIDGLLGGLTEGWKAILDWVEGIVADFAGFFSGLWEDIKGAASTAWEGIKDTVSGIWDGLSKSASETWEGIKTTVSDAWNNLKDAASEKWKDIKTTVSSVWNDLKGTATDVWSSVKTTISDTWNNLKDAATEKWNDVKATISDVWTGLQGSASEIWEGIKGTVSGVWDDLSKRATETWDNVKQTISDTWDNIKSGAETAWTNTTEFLSNTWDGVKSTADTAWQNIKNTVIGWFTGTRDEAKQVDWSGVGEGITNGTEGGITGLWSDFKSRVVNKFKSLVNSVKSTLGIASPSKVFKSIGGFMMEGLNDGIVNEEDAVFKTMGNLASSIADSSISAPDVEMTSNAVVSGMDRVASRLSDIAATFMQIASMLTAAGGFYAPAVAAGTVIPYKTRVAAESPSVGDSDPITAFTTNFDETMSDQRDLLRELIDVLRGKNLTIDGESLMKALNYLQRSQIRSYGGA